MKGFTCYNQYRMHEILGIDTAQSEVSEELGETVA